MNHNIKFIKKEKINFFAFLCLTFFLFRGIDLSFLSRTGLNPLGEINQPSKIISIFFILAIPFIFKNIRNILHFNKFLTFFIFWILLSTFCSYLYTSFNGFYVPFSNSVRTIEQLGSYLIGFILGYYVLKFTLFDPKKLIKFIHFSIVIVITGVLYQILSDGLSSVLYNRLYGISGEPKGLGLFLVPYVAALFSSPLKKTHHQLIIVGLCLSIILLTLSATSFISLFLVFLIFFLIAQNLKFKIYIAVIFLLLIAMVVVFSVAELRYMLIDRFYSYATGEYTDGIQVPFEIPFLGVITLEANDFPVAHFFKENPFLILSGVGLGQESIITHRYVKEFGGIGFLDINYEGYITPNMAILNKISNFGLLIYIFLTFYIFFISISIFMKLDKSEKFIFIFFLSHFYISLLIFQTSVPFATSIFFISALYVCKNIKNSR